MGSWKRFDKEFLPDKKAFQSSFNIKDIVDVDYRHAKRVLENYNDKNLGDNHDLYVQSDTLLLADVFENYRNKCIEKYELDPAHFLSALGLAWQAALKKTGIELELLTDIDMLLMVEKGIRGCICHATHIYAKANNEFIKNNDKNKELLYLINLDVKNLHEEAMSQKLPVDSFKWETNILKFHENLIKSYGEDSDKGYILEVDVKYPKELHDFHNDFPFLAKRMKIDNCKKLVCNLYHKEKCIIHIRALKKALNHGLILKKIHRVIEFN